MSDEWGPWIEHDGRGCPKGLVGKQVECVVSRPEGIARLAPDGIQYRTSAAWSWAICPSLYRIIRYRIRRPKALQQMIQRASELDAPEGPTRAPVKHGVPA